MFRPTQPVAPRKGVILLVVLSMLMLFAIVGIGFVIYANSEATTNRQMLPTAAETNFDAQPELLFSLALGQIIYDVPDDSRGAFSALRSHGIGRNMYGYNDAPGALNNDPYSGPGRLNLSSMFAPTTNVQNAMNDAYLINYTLVGPNDPASPALPAKPYALPPMRDPEHLGPRPAFDPKKYATMEQYANDLAQRGTFLAANPSYTYPDHNTFFLAAVKADGTLLTPSYHREWLFGRLDANPANPSVLPANQNPNWTNQEGRYLTLRPRPIDMAPGFPYPTDRYGDVKNLIGAPGGNDSFWIDIGAPVMTGPDGRRYKILVAPLIMDLDNRLNVNTAGNVMGANGVHNSNQGWGPWEVNLSKVLNSTASPGEWAQVLIGKQNASSQVIIPGKYGTAKVPPPATSPFATQPHPYASADFNGGPDGGAAGGGPVSLAGTGSTTPYQSTPAFDPNSYGNGSATELLNNAAGFNPYRPSAGSTSNNRVYSLSDIHAMLRHGDSGGEALTSQLVNLLTNNFNPNDPQAYRRRRMLTPFSFNLGRPAMLPYIFDPTAQEALYGVIYAAQGRKGSYPFGYPTGGQIQYPDVANRNKTPAGSDFDASTWRSAIAKYGKIDLNRALTAYTVNFHQAELDRQQLAVDVFNRLCIVTGATSPFLTGKQLVVGPQTGTAGGLAADQFEASRYLAQLAANIVDYIDADDYNTVFIWNPTDPTLADPFRDPDPKNPGRVNPTNFANPSLTLVFGTEPPKLVVNEVYVQLDNDPNDTGIKGKTPVNRAATTYNVNVWIELLNPFVNDTVNDNTAYLVDPNAATGAQPIYQIMLVDPPALVSDYVNPANVLGDPGAGMVVRNLPASGVTDFGPKPPANGVTWQVAPVDTAYSGKTASNQGFYVIGSNAPFMDPPAPGKDPANPSFPVTYASSSLTSSVSANTSDADLTKRLRPWVLLRRLVYPNQAPNPGVPGGAIDPTIPYNPYITVDYTESKEEIPIIDARFYDKKGVNPNTTKMAVRATTARRQPYDARLFQYAYSAPPNPPIAPPQPQNSFYRHNYEDPNTTPTNSTPPNTNPTLTRPFNWLPHLDRPLISPVELLQVSAHKPHELTHVFVNKNAPVVTTNNSANEQVAPWVDANSRLYRFFEMAETQSRLPGAAVNGRVPGKININTIWDLEILLALCDAQPSNTFYNSDATVGGGDSDYYVKAVFNNIAGGRTPGILSPTPIGQYDRPFKNFSIGAAPGADALDPNYPLIVANPPLKNPPNPTPRGIDDTLFRAVGGNGGFSPNVPNVNHPYYQNELLTKVYNNLTTNSNTFAVFLTVGFFEVVDETTRPVKLGAEIGASEGKNIRHRMFAVVDRTNLEVFGQPVATTVNIPQNATPLEVQLDQYDPKTKTWSALATNLVAGVNPNTNKFWTMQGGMVLTIEPDMANGETAVVYEKPALLDPTQPERFVQFRNAHAKGSKVISRGNPGPWLNYNPRRDPGVVPFFAIID